MRLCKQPPHAQPVTQSHEPSGTVPAALAACAKKAMMPTASDPADASTPQAHRNVHAWGVEVTASAAYAQMAMMPMAAAPRKSAT